jgi:hypothetical protein
MIYHVSFQTVSLVIGILYVLFHFWGIFDPNNFYHCMRKLIRSAPAGKILTGIAGAWAIYLVLKIDLGEFTHMKEIFLGILGVGTVLTIFFVQGFLFVRAVGMLLLLAACILLDAAFPETTPFRIIIVCLAYGWIIAGMIAVAAPYLFRELLRIGFKDQLKSRMLNMIGLVLGLVLIILGMNVFVHKPTATIDRAWEEHTSISHTRTHA